MSRPVLNGIAPFFIVRSVAAAVVFYRDQLGFDVLALEPEPEPFFALVGRDSAMLMLKQVGTEPAPNCLVPVFDGAILSSGWKEALWARFYTGAPPRQRRFVERYNIVKRA